MRFALNKWYIDVVADDGRTAVAYWASVRAGRLAHAVGGLLQQRDPEQADRAFTLRSPRAPEWTGSQLQWQCQALGVSIDAERRLEGFDRRLLATASGALDWRCDAPLAHVRFTTTSDIIEGLGYVERLQLDVAPWALPAMRVLWGRWTAPGRSVVWIAWEGSHPLCLVWVDGVLAEGAAPSGPHVDLGERGVLSLDDPQVITDATIGEQLASLSPLRALVDRIAHYRQTRWRARGVLRQPGCGEVTGWVIHEEVTWR